MRHVRSGYGTYIPLKYSTLHALRRRFDIVGLLLSDSLAQRHANKDAMR
jgi:hypothetical protein